MGENMKVLNIYKKDGPTIQELIDNYIITYYKLDNSYDI